MRIVRTRLRAARVRDRLGFDNTVANSVTNKLGDRVDAKLAQNACSMCFCGAHANAQRRCDVLVAVSFSQEVYNLTLARAERSNGLQILVALGDIDNSREKNC